jgi:glycosyltransferase involved in cell wall biosynthesis
MVKLSVVVPCYNEEAVVQKLAEVLDEELSQLTDDYEVLLVDDGSRDRTLELLRTLNEVNPRMKYLSFSRNFGKEAAMLAGLSQARGEAVAILDADLQHPPELLGPMLRLLDEGHDQVVARRNRSGDAPTRTLFSRVYYRMINRLVDVRLEDGVGDFRVLSRTAVSALLALGESNRFSKGLFAWIGFETAYYDYENVLREAGETKWRFGDLVNYGIDGILSFNSRPLRMAIHWGVLVSVIAFCYALWVVGDAILHGNPVPGYVTIITAVVGLGGVQMILLGIIGEYLGRIYLETKRRPHFLVKESSPNTAAPVAVLLGLEHRSVSTARHSAAHGDADGDG